MNEVLAFLKKVFSDWRYPAAAAVALLMASVVIAQVFTIPAQREQAKRSEQANVQRLCIAVQQGKALLYTSEVIDASIKKDPSKLVETNLLLQQQAAVLSEDVLRKVCPGPGDR